MTPVDNKLAHAPAQDLRIASAHGLATYASDGLILDVWFPQPALGILEDTAQIEGDLAAAASDDADRGTTQGVISWKSTLM